MKVMFSCYPFPGHLFPIVSTAWAMRAAGHDVLFASVAGTFTTIASTGLPGVEVVPASTIEGIFLRHMELDSQPGAARANARSTATPVDEDAVARRAVSGVPSEWSDAMTDGTVEFALEWQPDLVIHEAMQGAGAVAAAKLGVPAVEHRYGFGPVSAKLSAAMRDCLADAYRRHAVRPVPHRLALDVVPPSMAAPVPDEVWRMQYVPYGIGGMVPTWPLSPPERPRIVVTLGTTNPWHNGLGAIRAVIDAGAELDADLLVALGFDDASALGALPDNAAVLPWIPLHVLLGGCAAIVHHGGVSTTLTALACGVPQLVLPTDFDNFINADAVAGRGVGLRCEATEVTSGQLRRLLEDPGMRHAAQAVRTEISDLPSPTDLVDKLLALGA
jgi:UDP:flavonoid glycosyltransferase YjiC (YdhE family)